MKGRFRVDYPWYWTYWFGEDAIMRVQIVSPARLLASMACLSFAIVLVFLIVGTALAETTSAATLSLGIIPVFAIPLGIPVLYYQHARNRLADETEEKLSRRNSTLTISWTSIKRARIKKSSFQFQTEIESYRMIIRSRDARAMSEFLLNKLGDKFQVE